MAIIVGNSGSPSAIAEASFGAAYNTRRKGYIQNRPTGLARTPGQSTSARQGPGGAVNPLMAGAVAASNKLTSGIVDQQLAYGKTKAANDNMANQRTAYENKLKTWYNEQDPYTTNVPMPQPGDFGLKDNMPVTVPAGHVSGGGRGGGGGGGAGRGGVTQEYSAKQRADFNQRHQAIADAEKSGRFTPSEINDLYRQQAALDAGLKPIPKMNPPKQYPDGQGIGNTWADPTGKFMLSRNRYGDVQSKPIKPQMDAKDYFGLYSTVNTEMQKTDTKGEVIPPDPKLVEAEVQKRIQLFQGLGGSPMDALAKEGQPSEQAMVDAGWMPATGGAQDPTLGAAGGADVPTAPAMPEVGAEVNGYRFAGGDPSQQDNWEQL